jgi:hypothetical protein
VAHLISDFGLTISDFDWLTTQGILTAKNAKKYKDSLCASWLRSFYGKGAEKQRSKGI